MPRTFYELSPGLALIPCLTLSSVCAWLGSFVEGGRRCVLLMSWLAGPRETRTCLSRGTARYRPQKRWQADGQPPLASVARSDVTRRKLSGDGKSVNSSRRLFLPFPSTSCSYSSPQVSSPSGRPDVPALTEDLAMQSFLGEAGKGGNALKQVSQREGVDNSLFRVRQARTREAITSRDP